MSTLYRNQSDANLRIVGACFFDNDGALLSGQTFTGSAGDTGVWLEVSATNGGSDAARFTASVTYEVVGASTP